MKLKLYSLVLFLMLITTTVFAFPIPDTGITKCYDDTKEIPATTADLYNQQDMKDDIAYPIVSNRKETPC